ncbi:MAG: hypothetical protein H7125_10410, partial [Proteobacteria bacterium]|nr:hypothetical protein [Burkholderiales bacterium]
TSEREIDARRDRDVAQLDLTILGLQTHLKQVRSSEAELRRRVEGFSKASKAVPDNLMEDLTRTTTDATDTERMISEKRNEQEGVRAKYNELRTRFVELMKRDTASR